MLNYANYERFSCPEYRSPYLGGQRLLIPDLISLFEKGEKVCIPFSAGHELAYHLARMGCRVFASDNSEISYKIGCALKNGQTSTLQNIFAYLDGVNKANFGWYRTSWTLPITFPNFVLWKMDFLEAIYQEEFDAIYFGVPTILENGNCFHEYYHHNEPKIWTVETEIQSVYTLMHLCKLRGIKKVVSGFGTGLVELDQRMGILTDHYPNTKIVSVKHFNGFSDYVMLSLLEG